MIQTVSNADHAHDLQEVLRRTRACYEQGRFPPMRASRDWTVTASNDAAVPYFRVATPETAEKWYLVHCPGRMLAQV